MLYKEFSKQLQSGTLDRCYLFHGEEAYLRRYTLDRLKAKLVPPEAEIMNLDRFFDADFVAVAEKVMTPPFMAEHRLVILSDFDLWKQKNAEDWANLLDTIPPECTLIFSYETLPNAPDKRTSIYKTLKDKLIEVDFPHQSENHLIDWSMRHFSARGATADRTVCAHLIFLVGRDMTTLQNEISKVAAYALEPSRRQNSDFAAEGQKPLLPVGRAKGDCIVTKQHINDLVVPRVEANAFELTDAIVAGNGAKAATILATLADQQEPPEKILGALSKTIRGLYAAKLAQERGKSVDAVMKVCGYKSRYPAEKCMSAARRRSFGWCVRALDLCAEADGMLKGDGRDRVLEWLVAGLC